jgi:hypothetical protein
LATRRRADNPHQVTWHVYYGDVHVGTIGERAGVPVDVDKWLGLAGFIPACIPVSIGQGPRSARRDESHSRTQ